MNKAGPLQVYKSFICITTHAGKPKEAQKAHMKQRSQVMEPIWSLPRYPQEQINLHCKDMHEP